MSEKNFNLNISQDDPDVAYLKLPGHPGSGIPGAVAKQIRLGEIISNYKGPDIYLDFNQDEMLIGLEILA